MTTLFDPVEYDDVVRRLELIGPASARQWGKMTASQMLEHVARALEMAVAKPPMKQAFIGKLIGWAFRSGFVGPKDFPKNSPTGPTLIIKDEPDFARTKARMKTLLAEFHALGERGCEGHIHGFFGTLTGEEWGVTQRKHVDHHLRQFGA